MTAWETEVKSCVQERITRSPLAAAAATPITNPTTVYLII